MDNITITPEIFSAICLRIAQGESLRAICRDTPEYPAASAVIKYLLKHTDAQTEYECAREVQAQLLADEIFEIADDGQNDWMERKSKKGNIYRMVDHEAVTRSRLRIESRQWWLAKILPKKYGDKVAVETDGKAGIEPHLHLHFEQMSSRELTDLLLGRLRGSTKPSE